MSNATPSKENEMNAQAIKDMLEYAPKTTKPCQDGLLGFWHSAEDGDLFICSKCAGRLVAQGWNAWQV